MREIFRAAVFQLELLSGLGCALKTYLKHWASTTFSQPNYVEPEQLSGPAHDVTAVLRAVPCIGASLP